jgi:threonine/homoserine/homoserine lactone efflux protein
MFPPAILAAYLAATLLVVIAPGPDNFLAIGRGLSQGRAGAILSSIGAGLGILVHTLAAALRLARVFATGLFPSVLNPKPGLFVLAFIPQFLSATRGSVIASGMSILALGQRR